MVQKLWQFIEARLKGFRSGFVGGAMVWGVVIFPLRVPQVDPWVLWVLKWIGILGGAVAVAIVKVWGEDFYKQNIRPKLFKSKGNGKEQESEKGNKEKAA